MEGSARRTRGESAGLTREAVVAAAEIVAERSGVAKLSLRAVAVELGVSPTAIYHHVRDRDELLDAVADAFVFRKVLRRLPGTGTRKTAPLKRVRLIAHRLRRAGIEHPGLLSAIAGYIPEKSPSAQMDCAELIISDLLDAGAAPERAVVLYRAVVMLCVGDAIAYANYARPRATPLTDRLERHLNTERYAVLHGYLHRAAEPERDQGFDQQLDLVLQELAPH
ncbi:TetR/AcrR family transcriptional regulator [Amycolatopsis jiangsuensis]|uniref:AcrR family transcriptional regulator n=1 Tax=Amycolatopsis jiangsuensis TaxID=1181879 RepID=A0A840J787_9PSEU|nr:TetR/AcrR family transcriptional regulator [Amycolatopsis jiangsuensis]MBB4689258.1 AcrR family transcriptional regulator [Amycolatopsis jiangsuensis]